MNPDTKEEFIVITGFLAIVLALVLAFYFFVPPNEPAPPHTQAPQIQQIQSEDDTDLSRCFVPGTTCWIIMQPITNPSGQ